MPLLGSATSVPLGAELLREARFRETSGAIAEAIAGYEAAIAAAEHSGEEAVLAKALRSVAVARHHQGDTARARQDCQRSYALACALADDLLAAEALNTLGGLDIETGALEDARRTFVRALELAGDHRPLRARVEQNLGIIASIQGDLDAALACYGRSLDAYQACGDSHGCAVAYNNLGIVSTNRGKWGEAERYFMKCHGLAIAVDDRHLQGLCLVNQARVDIARRRFEEARTAAEDALQIFSALGAQHGTADAYRVLGVIHRETGHPELGESRFRTALQLAESSGSVLAEAEASREFALLCQSTGRRQEALGLLKRAGQLFSRLDARADLEQVRGKAAQLEGH